MEVRRIEVSASFKKAYRKLTKRVKDAAKEKELVFRNNPFDARLHTHKLHGKEKIAWAFSVTHAYRIKFIFLHEEEVLFLEIGTHEIYQ